MGFTLYLPLPDFHYTRTMDKPDQPWKQNPLLRMSYSLYAPIYDLTIERAMRHARQTSLAALPTDAPKRVLISGVGTGLDLPHLPELHHYTALDFNPAMLSHAIPRGERLGAHFVLGDSMSLPFADAQFDHVVLHLIVAVVPEPQRCLAEAARVLKPGGTVLLFDKFLHEGQRAPLRRLFNIFSRRFMTRMDVVLEEVLRAAPELEIASDEPALGGSWFRRIVLRKK
jgi:ubiquinone/menaquinone biosynthesis C-methylase UbiE